MPPRRGPPPVDPLAGRHPNLEDITPDGEPDFSKAVNALKANGEMTPEIEKTLNLLRNAYCILQKTAGIPEMPLTAVQDPDMFELRSVTFFILGQDYTFAQGGLCPHLTGRC